MSEQLSKGRETLHNYFETENQPFFQFHKVGVSVPSPTCRPILEDIDFSIPKGSKVVILGESGSGKSTLAKLLKGLIQSFKGKISVDGLDPSLEKDRHKIISRVGLIFSNPSQQLVAHKVEDDISFGLENQGMEGEAVKKKVDEVLSLLGISHIRKEMTYNLSMGEQLMVAAAGVIVMEPEALILDEPGAFVDFTRFKNFFSSIMKIKNGAKQTIVWITHNPEDALWADILLVLSRGRTCYFGRPKTFFSMENMRQEKSFLFPEIFNLIKSLKEYGVVFDKFPDSLSSLTEECLYQVAFKN